MTPHHPPTRAATTTTGPGEGDEPPTPRDPPRGLQIGDPSGHGRYGIVDRDWSSVLCHECGQWLGSVGGHLARAHDMTAAQYRREHGLSRSQPLICERMSAEASQRANAQLGTDAWQRLVDARDPHAASQSRAAAGWTGALPADRRATLIATASQQLPRRPRRIRTCPACGTQHQKRTNCCGAPKCVSTLKSQAARQENAERYRPLTASEITALQPTTGDALATLIRRLQHDTVSSIAIGRALDRSPGWMSKHHPRQQ